LVSQEKVWNDDSGTNGMLDQLVQAEGHVGQQMNDLLGIGSLLPDVLQDVMSAQLLQKPLQVFFRSDEVWRLEESGVVLAMMILPQLSSLDVPQDKIKRQVDLEGCGMPICTGTVPCLER
jgi:hypothetical protein